MEQVSPPIAYDIFAYNSMVTKIRSRTNTHVHTRMYDNIHTKMFQTHSNVRTILIKLNALLQAWMVWLCWSRATKRNTQCLSMWSNARCIESYAMLTCLSYSRYIASPVSTILYRLCTSLIEVYFCVTEMNGVQVWRCWFNWRSVHASLECITRFI